MEQVFPLEDQGKANYLTCLYGMISAMYGCAHVDAPSCFTICPVAMSCAIISGENFEAEVAVVTVTSGAMDTFGRIWTGYCEDDDELLAPFAPAIKWQTLDSGGLGRDSGKWRGNKHINKVLLHSKGKIYKRAWWIFHRRGKKMQLNRHCCRSFFCAHHAQIKCPDCRQRKKTNS